MSLRIRVNQVVDRFSDVAKKYDLDPRDAKLLFIEALAEFYGTNNIILYGEGIKVNDRYRNIRYKDFEKIIKTYNLLCQDRSYYKISNFVSTVLFKNEHIIYSKVIERGDYHYVLQPMLSKDTPLRYIEPIKIERIGIDIPEKIAILPIEIYPSSKRHLKNSNKVAYNAMLFSRKLASHHLDKLTDRMKERFKVHVDLEVKGLKGNKLFIQNRAKEKNLSPDIIRHIVNYFRNFKVHACIKVPSQKRS
jgi:hypothetical protein